MRVTLSAAVTADGYMDDDSPRRLIISTPGDWEEVYRLRAAHDAILAGAETLRRDDPSLLDRDQAARARRVQAGLKEKGPGEEVRLCVSTHNAPDRSSYFRWMYKENWEVKAEIFMAAEKMGNTVVIYDLLTSNNWYYCWGKDSSKVISLGSSDRLTQNVIANKSIASYHPSDRRFSMLYHAEVEQYALHREAYDYYFNLQKNIEESGSLFAPIPSEMKGNIRCVTDPEVPVIGFVEVATVTRLKRFFPEIEKVYEAEVTGCASTIVQGSEYDNNPDYGYVSYNPMNAESNTYALKRCMDCGRFGSKQKPSWWPTSHL